MQAEEERHEREPREGVERKRLESEPENHRREDSAQKNRPALHSEIRLLNAIMVRDWAAKMIDTPFLANSRR